MSPELYWLLAGFATSVCADPLTFHRDVDEALGGHYQRSHCAEKMPPWFADSSHQPYRDTLSLSAKQKETIIRWVDGGSPEGNSEDAPAPRTFVEGWNIGQPDRVIEMPEAYQVPATGIVEYTYIIVPSGLKEDTWVKAMEIRPGNRATMHPFDSL